MVLSTYRLKWSHNIWDGVVFSDEYSVVHDPDLEKYMGPQKPRQAFKLKTTHIKGNSECVGIQLYAEIWKGNRDSLYRVVRNPNCTKKGAITHIPTYSFWKRPFLMRFPSISY